MTPRSRKSGYGLLFGCGSQLDADLLKTNFFCDDVRNMNWPNPGKSSPSVLVRHGNRSGVVDLVGREPLMFAKVENGVTKSCHNFRRKKQGKRNFGLIVSIF